MPSLNPPPLLWLLPFSFTTLLYYLVFRSKPYRQRVIPQSQERVLILGASSGIGRAIAHLYASRDAYVCLVGRREDKLEAVRSECVHILPSREDAKILKLCEDFSDIEGLLRIRKVLTRQWEGLDTLIVTAGVSALQSLLATAGLQRDEISTRMTDNEGLTRLRDVAGAAMRGNFTGPLLSAVTYIPLLIQTSRSPSILLVSSVAAVIPAPTRSLYAASKAASLLLFQALSIEQPEVHFTSVLPSTVEGDFRSSAIDGGTVSEDLSKSLKKEHVARECVHAVDTGRRTLWLPWSYQFSPFLRWICPRFVDALARRKYNFHPK